MQDYSASKSLTAARTETRVIEKERIVRDHADKSSQECRMWNAVGCRRMALACTRRHSTENSAKFLALLTRSTDPSCYQLRKVIICGSQ